MDFTKKRWIARKLWLWVSLAIVFSILIGGCLMWNIIIWRINVRNEILNEYMPVRLVSVPPQGAVYEDGSAMMVFGIIDHSNRKQTVTFSLYQHNYSTGETQLFNIEQVFVLLDWTTKQEMENNVINIDAGEEIKLLIYATAKDSTKIKSSRAAPDIEIVTLKR